MEQRKKIITTSVIYIIIIALFTLWARSGRLFWAENGAYELFEIFISCTIGTFLLGLWVNRKK